MSLLHYSEGEMLGMTPRKFSLMLDAYRACNGIKEKDSGDSLADMDI